MVSDAAGGKAKTKKSAKKSTKANAKAVAKKDGVVFLSHCASEPLEERLRTPMKLRVAELKSALVALGVTQPKGKKSVLVAQLVALRAASEKLLDLQGESVFFYVTDGNGNTVTVFIFGVRIVTLTHSDSLPS